MSDLSKLYYSKEHEAFRATVRRFVQKEIEPFIDAWEEEETFPIELYRKASEIGLLGLGFPEEYGGIPTDGFLELVATLEICETGSGGIAAGLMTHSIAAPPILAFGSDELKQKVLTSILAGERIGALAITEPSGGSDVANLKTKAERDGDHYIINGSKTFITSGMRADYFTVAVRTGGEGMGGISLLVMDAETPGLSRTPLKKMGWWCSDTATIYFDNCRVPVKNILGEENAGFLAIMHNFNNERIFLASQAYGLARVCLAEAISYAKEREAFGKNLIKYQVIRHKCVDMATKIEALKTFLETTIYRVQEGEQPVAEVCMLKNFAVETIEFCAREAVQVLGGAGYIRGTKVERIYRDAKVLSIGGGTDEIMKELASRQLGW